MKHKRQHYIPSSYLKAWCDPAAPPKHNYVWYFSRDGSASYKGCPKKIFYKKDLYTIRAEDGERILILEESLSKIESKFSNIRTNKLQKHKLLTSLDRLYLFMFVCAMIARTPTFSEAQSNQWQGIYDWAMKFQNAYEEASEEKREKMKDVLSKTPSENNHSMSIDDIKEIINNPIQNFLPLYIAEFPKLMMQMPFYILETNKSNPFITSDNPCVWYDPASYKSPRQFGAGGLISPTIEISIPLSPLQLLLVANKIKVSGLYLTIKNRNLINNFNCRTRMNSDFFIANSEKVNPGWFMYGI